MLRSVVPFVTALTLTLGAPAAAVTLSTPLSGGNGQSGIMFDLVAGQQALLALAATTEAAAALH